MISTLILTYNEEINLPRCLDALSWCDDVVVLDSFSTDRTVEIARSHGARVIQRRFDEFASQRNHGLLHGGLRHEWVLHLDADEVVPPELRDEMLRRVSDAREDAFRLPSKLIFKGRWLRHAGMYPTYQVRLGRRDRLRFQQVGHGQREVLGPETLGTLRHALLHHSFAKGLTEWFEKHNRYSTAEALHAVRHGGADPSSPSRRERWLDPVQRRRMLKELSTRLPCRPLLRFLYMYLWRRGFLDGLPGYRYCRLLAIYEYMIVLKTSELRDSEASHRSGADTLKEAGSVPSASPRRPRPHGDAPREARGGSAGAIIDSFREGVS